MKKYIAFMAFSLISACSLIATSPAHKVALEEERKGLQRQLEIQKKLLSLQGTLIGDFQK